MTTQLRNVRLEEFGPLMRLLERAFGHSYGFFRREYPHLYHPTEEACRWAYVIEEGGELIAHVGIYPLEVVIRDVRLRIGGIGAVATAPEARGKGYMTRLLRHAVTELRAQNYPLSWLGGDRQRYNTFGWEMAGPAYRLTFTKRSLTWDDAPPPLDVEAVLPWTAAPIIAGFMDTTDCHTVRPDLDLQLRKQGIRAWIGEEGYALANAEGRHGLKVLELVSTRGEEVRWLHALQQSTGAPEVTWDLGMGDALRLARVLPVATDWNLVEVGMYRVNDLVGVLRAFRPLLGRRAEGLGDFAVTLALAEHDRTTAATLRVRRGEVAVVAAAADAADVTLSPPQGARLLLGGPPIPQVDALPASLRALLPLPGYVPPLDRV